MGETPVRPLPERPNFAMRREGEVLAVAGDLDLATAAEFGEAVRAGLREGPLVLDLSELRFMDSSGVRALDALLGDTAREGWQLAVRPEMRENVRQVLQLTGMLELLPLEATQTEDR